MRHVTKIDCRTVCNTFVSDKLLLMSMRPLVSICIPTYNAEEFLAPCLSSALAQTYSDIEILICDDGSVDGTIGIVKNFQLQHTRIRLIQNQANLGMVNNWNECIKQAKGDWIKFLFQDDLLEPSCVEEMISACLQHNVLVGLCRRDFILHEGILPHLQRDFGEGGIKKAEDVFGDSAFISPGALAEAISKHLLQNFMGEPSCYLFHKALCDEVGFFNKDLKQVVDYEFITRLGLVNGLAFCHNTLAHFRIHSKSESSANNQRSKNAQIRNIAAETGDSILLVHLYSREPAFKKLRDTMGEQVLEDYTKQLYFSACKHKGKKLVNEALEPIRSAYPVLGKMHYSFFNYVKYRRRMKKWFRELKKD